MSLPEQVASQLHLRLPSHRLARRCYARQRALSISRNSLPRGAPFYNAFYDVSSPIRLSGASRLSSSRSLTLRSRSALCFDSCSPGSARLSDQRPPDVQCGSRRLSGTTKCTPARASSHPRHSPVGQPPTTTPSPSEEPKMPRPPLPPYSHPLLSSAI